MKAPAFALTLLFSIIIFCFFSASPALAQTQLVSSDYFPAEFEFKELQKVLPEQGNGGKDPLPAASEAPLFAEVGYQRYSRRTYQINSSGRLTIEIVTAKDERAAYSLLTLLRKGRIVPGPPGDSFSASENLFLFVKGNFWVRIQGTDPGGLQRRVSISVSNRIGPRDRGTPTLVSHLPLGGLDDLSERYLLGPMSFGAYARKITGLPLEFRSEMEIVQAQYNLKSRAGVLSLISFPTGQMASDFFDGLSDNLAPGATRLYSRRVGPIVGILDGSFDPATADEILGNIKFTYSIKWIYDKNNRSSTTVWGVPVGILGTVVRSLLLTVLLCGISILAGVSIAVFRMLLRGYAPGNFLDAPERTGMIRLRLSEVSARASDTIDGHNRTEAK